MRSAPADPKIRRLVRVSPLGPSRSGVGASDRSSYSDLENGIPPDALPVGSGGAGADAGKSAPVIAGLPWVRRATPMSPRAPGMPPLPPMPQIPEWLKVIGRVLQFDPRTWSGPGGNDAYRRCIKAASGSTEEWEEYCRDLGPGQNHSGRRITEEGMLEQGSRNGNE